MYFIFGTLSIKSKEFNYNQFKGIDCFEGFDNYKFIIKIKCFHFFWIPLFPLEIIYLIKDLSEGKTFPMQNEQRKYLINEYKTSKNPWWSFLGLWLILFGVLFITMKVFYKEYKRDVWYEEKANFSIQCIDKTKVGDYYNLLISNEHHPTKGYYFSVKEVTKDSLILVNMFGDKKVDSRQYTVFEESFLDSLAIIALEKNYKVLSISKKDLKDAVPTDRKMNKYSLVETTPIKGIGNVTLRSFSTWFRCMDEKMNNYTN